MDYNMTVAGYQQQTGAAASVSAQPMTVTADSLQYLNGFLRTQIGRPVRIEFLLGTDNLIDRTGTLVGVGANYLLIIEAETDDLLACDFYNIKFVTFYR